MTVETYDDVRAMIDDADFGWVAIYTPSGGTGVSTVVLVDVGVELEDGADADAAVGSHTITMLCEDVPEPARNATIVATNPDKLANETYLVNAVLYNDGKVVSVACSKVAP